MSQYTGDNNSYENAPTRDRLFTRWGQLKSERASWWAHYQELTTFILHRNVDTLRKTATKDTADITPSTTTQGLAPYELSVQG
jgi:hypothetical protein